MKKAIACSSLHCQYKYHQELFSTQNITVHHCPQCGSAGRMIMGPGQPEVTGSPCYIFARPKFPLPELSLPVNRSYLEASPREIQLLHEQAIRHGFTCIGFHGCGSNAAESILKGVQDVSTTNARGRGFMIGSLYSGIPSIWARQVKGGGTATILRVYVRNWPGRRVDIDYQWGKMDPDDDVSTDGLEMVLRPRVFNDIVALPSIGDTDQALIAPVVWQNCPRHSFRPEEMQTVQEIARHLNISLDALEREIESNPGRIEKEAQALGLNL